MSWEGGTFGRKIVQDILREASWQILGHIAGVVRVTAWLAARDGNTRFGVFAGCPTVVEIEKFNSYGVVVRGRSRTPDNEDLDEACPIKRKFSLENSILSTFVGSLAITGGVSTNTVREDQDVTVTAIRYREGTEVVKRHKVPEAIWERQGTGGPANSWQEFLRVWHLT